MKIGIDFRVGLDFDFDGASGQLIPTISTIAAADVQAGVIATHGAFLAIFASLEPAP